jgi:hypothetical protein
MSQGLSKMQRWLLANYTPQATLDDLALAFYGRATPATSASLSRALKILHARGFPLTHRRPTRVKSAELKWHVEVADVLDFLKRQPDKSVDLVLSSPPYGDGQRTYCQSGIEIAVPQGEEWVCWMVEVVEESLRVCKGLVAYVMQASQADFRWSALPAKLLADLDRKGVCLRRPILYGRYGIPGSAGPDWFRQYYEFVVCATNGGKLPWSDQTAVGNVTQCKINGYPSYRRDEKTKYRDAGGRQHYRYVTHYREYDGPDKAVPGDLIWCGMTGGAHPSRKSEAPFSELLVEVMVKTFCKPGGVLCDPFCGSGTALAVAYGLGRQAIGCDVREDQVQATRKRLENIQPPLWC